MELNFSTIDRVVTRLQREVAEIHMFPEFHGISSALIPRNKGKDYTSAIDKKGETIIKPALLKLVKDSGYLGEESASQGLTKRYIWIHDSLDGTGVKLTNGIYFSNSIAFADMEANNGKGGIIFSSVYQSWTGKQFVAFRDNLTVREFIHTKNGLQMIERLPIPSFTEGYAELNGCAFGTSTHLKDYPGMKEKLANVFSKDIDPIVQRMYGLQEYKPASGSSALYCSDIADSLASNKHFALLFYQKAWDLAAGATFAQKAGCPIVMFDNYGNIINQDLQSTIAHCDNDTNINVGVFANEDVKEHVLKKFYEKKAA